MPKRKRLSTLKIGDTVALTRRTEPNTLGGWYYRTGLHSVVPAGQVGRVIGFPVPISSKRHYFVLVEGVERLGIRNRFAAWPEELSRVGHAQE